MIQPNSQLLLKMLQKAGEKKPVSVQVGATASVEVEGQPAPADPVQVEMPVVMNATVAMKPVVESVTSSLSKSGASVMQEEKQKHLGYVSTDGPHGYFRLDYGHTVSLGDFQYAKVTASISVPVGVTDEVADRIIKDANSKYDMCRQFLESRLAEEIEKLNRFALEFQERAKGGSRILNEDGGA